MQYMYSCYLLPLEVVAACHTFAFVVTEVTAHRTAAISHY